MSLVYNQFKTLEANGTIDLLTDTIKVMLVGSTYTANADDSFISPTIAGGQELSGTGYASGYGGSGRKTLTSKTVTRDDTNDWALFSAAPVTWSAINAGTAAAFVVIRERASTGDTMSELIGYINDGFPVTTNGGDLTLTFTNGILKLS